MLRAMTLSALVFLAAPVLAEEVTMTRAITAGSLHEGPLDMVASYRPIAEGSLEVAATFATHDAMTQPMRVVMAMRYGDAVAFAMPGYRDAYYSFSRTGAAVRVAVESRAFPVVRDRAPTEPMTTAAAAAP